MCRETKKIKKKKMKKMKKKRKMKMIGIKRKRKIQKKKEICSECASGYTLSTDKASCTETKKEDDKSK